MWTPAGNSRFLKVIISPFHDSALNINSRPNQLFNGLCFGFGFVKLYFKRIQHIQYTSITEPDEYFKILS